MKLQFCSISDLRRENAHRRPGNRNASAIQYRAALLTAKKGHFFPFRMRFSARCTADVSCCSREGNIPETRLALRRHMVGTFVVLTASGNRGRDENEYRRVGHSIT